MTYKKMTKLSNEFMIKLSIFENATNPNYKPKESEKTKPSALQKIINPITMQERKPHEDLPEVPMHLQQLIMNRDSPFKDEVLTDSNSKNKPEDRQVAEKTFEYAKSVNYLMTQDYGVLLEIGYFQKHPEEKAIFDEIHNKIKNLELLSQTSPYRWKMELTLFLNETPKVKLFNQASNKKSATNLDNIEKIYYDSYSDSIRRHSKLGLGDSKMLRPLKLFGLRKLMLFDTWVNSNM
jgi:hypothetical protein